MHVYMQVEGEHIAKNVHTTTAQLPCHLQNFLAIISLEFGWEQNEHYQHTWIELQKLIVRQAQGSNLITSLHNLNPKTNQWVQYDKHL